MHPGAPATFHLSISAKQEEEAEAAAAARRVFPCSFKLPGLFWTRPQRKRIDAEDSCRSRSSVDLVWVGKTRQQCVGVALCDVTKSTTSTATGPRFS